MQGDAISSVGAGDSMRFSAGLVGSGAWKAVHWTVFSENGSADPGAGSREINAEMQAKTPKCASGILETHSKTTMNAELIKQAIVKLLSGILLLGLLLFLPAGTLHWWQGWLLMGILFIPMFVAGLVMMEKSSELLKKRLNAREEQDEQKQVILYSGLVFLAAFVVAGLNFRFRWIMLPDWVSWAFAGVFLLGYALYAEVLRENVWLSRTVEVQEGQSVVDTGLYGVVRHPMYMSTLVLFLSMPLVLGSIVSFIIMLAYIPIIVRRIRNEERVLEQGLAGYSGYRRKVRWKVIPRIW